MNRKTSPAAELEHFLKFVETCKEEHGSSYAIMQQEEMKVQDFLHAIEFAQDKKERNRIATQLQASRRNRRKHKDIVIKNELIVNFFDDPKNREIISKMQKLLHRQRSEENYLFGDRSYTPRAKQMEEGETSGG